EASRKLGFSSKRTMGVAQQLYEGVDLPGEGSVGLITYMRTDSPALSQSAQDDIAALVAERYGRNYVKRTQYKAKAKQAQEAHEGIRTTAVARTPGRGAPPPAPPPRGGPRPPRPVPAPALRADLEAGRGLPDGPGPVRPDQRRHQGRRAHLPGHRVGAPLRRVRPGLPGGPRRRCRGGGRNPARARRRPGAAAGGGHPRAALHRAAAPLQRG